MLKYLIISRSIKLPIKLVIEVIRQNLSDFRGIPKTIAGIKKAQGEHVKYKFLQNGNLFSKNTG